jgi:hypothetical protein
MDSFGFHFVSEKFGRHKDGGIDSWCRQMKIGGQNLILEEEEDLGKTSEKYHLID